MAVTETFVLSPELAARLDEEDNKSETVRIALREHFEMEVNDGSDA